MYILFIIAYLYGEWYILLIILMVNDDDTEPDCLRRRTSLESKADGRSEIICNKKAYRKIRFYNIYIYIYISLYSSRVIKVGN